MRPQKFQRQGLNDAEQCQQYRWQMLLCSISNRRHIVLHIFNLSVDAVDVGFGLEESGLKPAFLLPFEVVCSNYYWSTSIGSFTGYINAA